MLRRLFALLLALALILPLSASIAAGTRYATAPPPDWEENAALAGEHDLLPEALAGCNFVSRAAFSNVLERLFAGTEVTLPSLSEEDGPVTRGELAEAVTAALGYETLSSALSSPFPDAGGQAALLAAFGLMDGGNDGLFHPDAPAPREQVITLLSLLYEKVHSSIDFLHGFYAFSSYSQIAMTAEMDAVSVGWAMMDVGEDGTPFLNQTAQGGNSWVLPEDPSLATDYFRGNGTACNLSVYVGPSTLTLPDGTVTDDLHAILATPEARETAVELLVSAAAGYDGLTIDFEGLRSDLKEPFTAFMSSLRAALDPEKTLYVCVQPDDWYDGFDYRALGEICDKVILMAHDYQWPSVPESYLGTSNTDTPVTPFPYIYAALRDVTDPETGVADREKLVLAVSMAAAALEVDEDGILISQTIHSLSPQGLIARLRQSDAEVSYSEAYRNPFLTYTTEEDRHFIVWYEDERSVLDKVALARMFGVTGLSIWRIGNIPSYPDQGLYYDVWSAVQTQRTGR